MIVGDAPHATLSTDRRDPVEEYAMSTGTLSLHSGLTPAKWRVLNALFYAGTGGINLRTLRRVQSVGDDALCEMEATSLVEARLGTVRTELRDMGVWSPGLVSAVRVDLTPEGHRVVVGNKANQVIAVLGSKSNLTARVRDLKGEGMADDDLIRRMDAAGLVMPANLLTDGAALATFKHLPRDLPIRLTKKGRRYFPNK